MQPFVAVRKQEAFKIRNVFLALRTQPAKRMGRLWSVWLYNIFDIFSLTTWFSTKKKVMSIKCVI
jgi:hypothetical protein